MKAVMISIQPQWVKKILNEEKTVEVRKSAPKLKPPFKCFIYCTKSGEVLSYQNYCGYDMDDFSEDFIANGKVVAEFICDEIKYHGMEDLIVKEDAERALAGSCLTRKQVIDYLGGANTDYAYDPHRFDFYGWHISELKIYDKPKEVCEFFYPCIKHKYPYCFDCEHGLKEGEERPMDGMRHYDVACGNWLKRPPQSWCYVWRDEWGKCGERKNNAADKEN